MLDTFSLTISSSGTSFTAGSWRALVSRIYARCSLVRPRISGFTNIKYLTIHIRALCGITLPLPLFRTVTHLELLAIDTWVEPVDVDRIFSNLSLIPRLTHIAINPYLDRLLPHAAFCANAQLQCIIFFNRTASLDDSPLLGDSRLVCIDDGSTYYADWLRGAVFGRDYWSFADDFLAARRAGTIDRASLEWIFKFQH
ncbi:hypothetical protein MSAN_00865900 [Mycena sanguinolenta]|uniref:Uncharacterized protein n=1 Tax=Mycena sanguinolenta TaxID=230812 RepID=A0A8H6Z179_9AGAR|nr:hypothetical protein MSAN_00865900 [Mycena sanguinolenta]